MAVEANGRRFARTTLGSVGVGASRLLIEAELRQRVRGWPRVRIAGGVSVLTPTHNAGRVTGVQLQRADGTTAMETWPASLVIDCSGRGSRSPAWLRDWGYDPPVEERVTIGLAYTSAYFRRDPLEEATAVIGSATQSFRGHTSCSRRSPTRRVVPAGWQALAATPAITPNRR